ncbi:hypothetical protein KA082_00100 [Candidatus Woesebacteria bacterium]|nr:hypothetical protein [Candidatus Woesebacteria bacterium]
MHTFFTTILLSISSLGFYAKLIFHSLSKSIRFYLLFLLLAAVVRSLPIYFYYMPHFVDIAQQSFSEFIAYYPANLAITWNGKELLSNSPELPIYYSEALKKEFGENLPYQYFGYFTASSAATQNTDALMSIDSTTIFLNSPGKKSEPLPIASILGQGTLELNKQTFEKLATTWRDTKASYLAVFGVLLPFISFFLLIFQRGIMLLMEAALFYFFKRIQGIHWSYATSIIYAIHIFVPAEIVSFVAQYVYPASTVSFFSLTVWIYFICLFFMPRVIRIGRES